jgi:agmatine deiminase
VPHTPVTPRELPAEWEPQSGVMLTWPHDQSDWAPYLADIEPVYVEIARAVCARERLLVCCRDEAHVDHVQLLLRAGGVDPGRVILRVAPSNDSWARDHGPITVLHDGAPVLLDFVFNGWGGKYPADLDNRITRRLHAAGAFGATPIVTLDLVLEGGGIESDGKGTLLTTTTCLLSKGRNPHLTRAQIEQRLIQFFNLKRVLWLEHGHLEGDDTDSHIDTLARFCDPHTIAYVRCDDASDAHYADLRAMEDELRNLRDYHGNPYRLVPLPWPQPKHDAAGKRLPATYANFLVINGAVLLPTYDDPADAVAVARLRECFPQREIVPIHCLPLIQQFGSLHCITMQLPAGVLPPL